MAESKIKIYKPQEGFQERFVSSNVDVCFGGGVLNCGKTFASILSVAEMALDPEFRGVFIRTNYNLLKTGGGLFDEFKAVFGENAEYKSTDPPRVTFPSGAYVEFRQIANEDLRKIQEEWKGSQWTLEYGDELTSWRFSTFKYLMSRLRSKSRFHPTFKATMNPDRDSWIRTWIDWYVGPDGRIIPERDGIVRYFYIWGSKPDEVYWGNTKREVYEQGKIEIDKKLRSLGGDFTYENLIKSFVFYLGKMSENKASIEGNMDYAGSVASVGGHQAQQLIDGNWNVSAMDDGSYLVKPTTVNGLPMNTPQTNGLKYICADLADTGTNSTIIGVFDGLHWMDAHVLNVSTVKENAEWIKQLMRKYGIAESHVIYDAQRAEGAMQDYIPEAIPYYSFSAARGKGRFEYKRRKDENAARLIDAINRGGFSIAPEVANMLFERKRTGDVTILQKLAEECSVVKWAEDSMSGKKRLLSKKEMNSQLGKGESMDCWDMCSMLMSVYEQEEYGMELQKGLEMARAEDEEGNYNEVADIYDDSTWA